MVAWFPWAWQSAVRMISVLSQSHSNTRTSSFTQQSCSRARRGPTVRSRPIRAHFPEREGPPSLLSSPAHVYTAPQGNLTHQQTAGRQNKLSSNTNLQNWYQIKSKENKQRVLIVEMKTATDDDDDDDEAPEDISNVVKYSAPRLKHSTLTEASQTSWLMCF